MLAAGVLPSSNPESADSAYFPMAVAAATLFMDEVFLPTRHTAYPLADSFGAPIGILSFRQVAGEPPGSWAERRRARLHGAT